MKSPQFLPKLKKLRFLSIYKVSGNSMSPALNHGQLVIVGNWLPEKLNQKIIVFNHEGLTKIKRVKSSDKDGVYVVGDNLNHSTDSRHFGTINYSQLTGIVLFSL